VQILKRFADKQDLDNIEEDILPLIDDFDLNVEITPFRKVDDIIVPISCDHEYIGLSIGECSIRRRAYIRYVHPKTSCGNIRNFKKSYTGAYIVQVNDTAVYSLNDTLDAINIMKQNDTITQFILKLSPDKYIPKKDRRDHLSLNMNQIRHIALLQYEIADDHSSMNDVLDNLHKSFIRDAKDTTHDATPSPTDNSDDFSMTDEEQILRGKYSRRKLKQLGTWFLWLKNEQGQLDRMDDQGMFGKPCSPPKNSIVLNQVWRYYFKGNVRKVRECCDGSPRAAPFLHAIAQTYASCIEHPSSRMYYGLCAIWNLIILTTDVVNAFANAPAPSIPTFLRIDDAFHE
jgi:hypothetical protein